MASIGLIEQMVENPGMPIRQPSVALLTVDTGDRVKREAEGQYISTAGPVNDIYINKGQPVMQGYFTRVALTEVNIPWNIPNVIAGYNNAMGIIIPIEPGVIPVVVRQGFYTGTELADAVTTAIADAITVLTPTYPAVNAQYDILCSYNDDGTFEFVNQIGSGAGVSKFAFAPVKAADPTNITTVVQESLLYIMGLSGLTSNIPVAGKWITAVAPLIYTPYIDVTSSQLTKKQQVMDNSTSYLTGNNLLARIYLNYEGIVPKVTAVDEQMIGCRPFTILKEFKTPKQIYWDTKEFLNVIDLQLRDAWGKLLQEIPNISYPVDGVEPVTNALGTNVSNWQLTFQVSEI